MRLQEHYDMELLRNRMAELVFEWIAGLIERRDDFCKCQDCVLDLTAYVLNHVKPLYCTSLLGSLYPDEVLGKKLRVQIELAVHEGLKKIKNHPHHEQDGGERANAG
jgi:competence protein ComFB